MKKQKQFKKTDRLKELSFLCPCNVLYKMGKDFLDIRQQLDLPMKMKIEKTFVIIISMPL